MSGPSITGSCACHACTWTSEAHSLNLDFCYCYVCQQISGSPFGAWLGIPRASLDFLGPITHISIIPDLASRSFCSKCGGTLTIQYHCYPHKTHVAAGTVVESKEKLPRVGCHLWVSSKPEWYTIPEDGVERWDEFPEEFQRIWGEWNERRGEV